MEDLDSAVALVLGEADSTSTYVPSSSTSTSPVVDTGVGKYTLMAIISHIGKNTEHGHYVCHIQKEGQWVLYNDEKVRLANIGDLIIFVFTLPICSVRLGNPLSHL